MPEVRLRDPRSENFGHRNRHAQNPSACTAKSRVLRQPQSSLRKDETCETASGTLRKRPFSAEKHTLLLSIQRGCELTQLPKRTYGYLPQTAVCKKVLIGEIERICLK